MAASAPPDANVIHAVLVNFHRAELTARAVDSALASQGATVRAIVIDNESDGQWPRHPLAADPRVSTIVNAANVGFGAACNQGIERALADPACAAVLLLNNDALLAPDCAARLLAAASQPAAAPPSASRSAARQSRHGLAAPRILLPDGRLYAAGGLAELTRARCRNRGWHAADTAAAPAETLTFASACVLLLTAAALRASGPATGPGSGPATGAPVRFWEPYFLYYEDADLCLRLAARGFAVRYDPRAVATHLESASSAGPGQAARLLYYDVRNRWWFVRRNARGLARLAGMAYWWALVLARGRRSPVVRRAAADALAGRGGPAPADLPMK